MLPAAVVPRHIDHGAPRKILINSTQYGENPVQTFLLSSFRNVGFIGVRDRASGADFWIFQI